MTLFPAQGTLKPLRWTQIPVPDEIAKAFREGHKHVMVQAPCGFGKTVVAAHIMSRSAAKAARPLFMAPAIALINQTLKSFEQQGMRDIGVMQANHPRTNPYAHTQLASRDTLIRRQLPDVRLVMIDEAHDQRDKVNELLEGVWADTYVIGLSATPWSRGLGRYYTKLIIADTLSGMIEQGRLSPFKLWWPDDRNEPNASGLRKIGGDFREDDAARVMGEARLVGDAVESWLRRRQAGEHCGDRTFLYGVNRAHAKSLMEKFQAEGVSCGYIDGNSTDEERAATFKRYRTREDKVLCNVGVLKTGVDEDVRVIVDCALRGSEIDWVQVFGRGLRLADGKDYCIARDSLILTQHGLVKIQDITLDHLVWDGVDFVQHGGSVCKGVRRVIEHDGIVGTPDHEVMTNDGFTKLGDAKHRQAGIVTSGLGRYPIRVVTDNVPLDRGWRWIQHESGCFMLEVCQSFYDSFLQHTQTAIDYSLSRMLSPQVNSSPQVALCAMHTSTCEMQEPYRYKLSALWGPRNTVLLSKRERCSAMDSGQSWRQGSFFSDRPNRQRWALRSWEPALEFAYNPDEQHAGIRRHKTATNHRFSQESPNDSVRRSYTSPIDAVRDVRRGNYSEVEYPIVETEREVWDILNAGPLQRFTANGKLVHNCRFYDHGGNAHRLGLPTWIHHDHMDTRGSKDKGEAYEDEKPVPKPRKCQNCNAAIPPATKACPSCGNVYQPVNRVEHLPGELVEMSSSTIQTPDKKPAKPPKDVKQDFYSGLLQIAQRRGFKPHWASHKYREWSSVWPQSLVAIPKTPNKAVREFVAAKDAEYRRQKRQQENVRA